MKKKSMSRQTKVFLENLSTEGVQLLDVDNLGKVLSIDVNALDNDFTVDKINEIRLDYAKQILQKDPRTSGNELKELAEILHKIFGYIELEVTVKVKEACFENNNFCKLLKDVFRETSNNFVVPNSLDTKDLCFTSYESHTMAGKLIINLEIDKK